MMMYRNAFLLFLIVLVASACSTPTQSTQGDKIRVVATTSIISDVVKEVGGDAVEVYTLVPPGVDEHSFQYNPEDITAVAGSEIVFSNGADLEPFLHSLLEAAGVEAKDIPLSTGIDLHASPLADDEHGDPHVWTDPNNVKGWVDLITSSLIEQAPEYADQFHARSSAYQESLTELDQWIEEQVATVPPANRKLVSDHQMFTYFAERYGFTQVGALIPSYSTEAQPSAQELASLVDAIRGEGIKAIFIGKTINPNLAEQLTADTGIRLVSIYTGSLSEAGGPASSYLDYMRYNVKAIVDGLK